MKITFKTLILFSLALFSAQAYSQITAEQLASIENGQKLEISGQVMVKEAITIKDKKDITITGSGNAEIVTFNSEPHVLKFENCENVRLENLKVRFGIEGTGESIIVLQGVKGAKMENLDLGSFGQMALSIDSLSTGIILKSSKVHDCGEMGIQSFTADLEVSNCAFSSNSKIGRHKPDIDIQLKQGYPLIQYNEYQVSEYIKHKTTIDEYVASRNSMSYTFDCFKIVKKYELADGTAGKVTAFFEGENNKILDKLELEYKGSKGQITATAYYLHGNLIYTKYEVKKGKIGLNYLVYGDFLEHLEKANSKASAHVSGNPASNKKQYQQWLKTLASWKAYLFAEAEEWELYENKESFITLPY